MALITLRDILISARNESALMRHNYLGAEHLFIALLDIPGGLTSTLLQEQGLAPLYVRDAIRRKIGKGPDQRLWVGFRYTPRTNVILDIARDLAADQALPEPGERELLTALLVEGDSLPIHLLRRLGADIGRLRHEAPLRKLTGYTRPPEIAITFAPDIDPAITIDRKHLFILRRMFAGYPAVRIERRLAASTKSLVLVVTPIQPDGRELAPTIAKIGLADAILDEAQRYETHVKSSLPLQTARLEDPPTAPDNSDLAGIKYTLVASTGSLPQDLRSRVKTHGLSAIGNLLRSELFERFSKNWWQQNRPFRFQVWAEYDWILPPVLTIDLAPVDESANVQVIRIPFNRTRLKARLQQISIGDLVRLENFTVYKVDRAANTLKLAIGYGAEADKRAYKVEVRGLNQTSDTFYRGEIVERLAGRVWKTRHDILLEALYQAEPDFDPAGERLPAGSRSVLNPLRVYDDLLDLHVNGSLSRIHGDLHLGNILVGPGGGVWLIDFADTRDGHTLFDWATFEISLLGDAIMPLLGDDWDSVRQMFDMIATLDAYDSPGPDDARLRPSYDILRELHSIVGECLTTPDSWAEYHIALALCGLRATTFKTMRLGGRRLAFLLAGLASENIVRNLSAASPTDTPSPDETDSHADRLVLSMGEPQTDIPSPSDLESAASQPDTTRPAPFGSTRPLHNPDASVFQPRVTSMADPIEPAAEDQFPDDPSSPGFGR